MDGEASDRSHRVYDVVVGRRVSWRVYLVSLAVVMVGVAAFAAPSALALSQRGHEYGFSFAGPGSGDGQLSDPGAVAVSEVGPSAGDVYVLDRGNNRVVQYGPKGEFISAWGWGVGSAQKKYEVCTSGCHAGFAGAGKDELNGDTSVAIAVDNSTGPSAGDVYLVTEGRRDKEGGYEQIDKLTAAGEPVEAITEVRYLESEPTATKKKERKEEEEALTETVELEASETHGLTVAPDGTVWLYYGEELYGLSGVKLSEDTFKQKPLEFTVSGEPALGVAVDARGAFYLAWRPAGEGAGAAGLISKWEQLPAESGEGTEFDKVIEALDREDSTAVATDQTGVPGHEAYGRDDVYLANLETKEGKQTTSVAQFSPGGAAIQRFTAPDSDLREGAGIAVDGKTGAVYVTDAAATANDVAVFTPEKAGAPTIESESLSAQDVSTQTSGEEVDVRAQLDASIDPRGATAKTAYRFEYGTAPCGGGGCAKVSGGELGGQGFADEGFGEEGVSVKLGTGTASPLAPATTYRYRVLAENSEHGQSVGEEGSFSTPPAKGPFIADGRDWEMVSPAKRDGASVLPLGGSGSVIQAAANGGAIAYIASGPFGQPAGNRSIEHTQILSTRTGPGDWPFQDLVTPSSAGEGLEAAKLQEYQFFSPDLAVSLLYPPTVGGLFAEPPLAPPASPVEEQRKREEEAKKEALDYQEKTIYLRADAPLEPQGETETALYGKAQKNGKQMENEAAELGQHAAYPGFLALVTGLDAPGVQFGGYEDLVIDGATPDLGHVVIGSATHLSAPYAPEGNLYEWSAATGALEAVNLLPGGAPVSAELGGPGVEGGGGGGLEVEDFAHAISTDGARVIFSPKQALGPEHLYMRDLEVKPAQSIELDTVQSGGSGEGPSKPRFQSASADGSRVFFTDERQLSEHSGAGEGRLDLYVFEMTSAAGEAPAGRVTDLTPTYAGQDAEVQGRVLGASEDGAYVYFVADGVLSAQAAAAHASRGNCREAEEGSPNATCNLYVAHYDGEAGHEGWQAPLFIAALSGEDRIGAWRSHGQGEQTARVSPNGRFLAFMSDRGLTSFDGRPYDTAATSPAAHGAPAEEVYEYAAPSAEEIQAGAAGHLTCASCEPSGARPAGVFDPPKGQASLLVDLNNEWGGRWLAGSLPAWAATEANSVRALYQSRYLSDSGRLYFDSPEDLVPEAINGLEDVYEYEPTGVPQGAHECTSQSATYSERAAGCIGLISSGTSTSESAFLDASETGGEGPEGEVLKEEGGADVFFMSAAQLTGGEDEAGYALYDAHECTRAQEPCALPASPGTQQGCASTAGCRPFAYSTPAGAEVAPSAGAGNVNSHQKVLGTQVKAKPLTRAQKLAKALAACKKRYRHAKGRRLSCEKQAHKRYGPLVKRKGRATRKKGGSR